jgi:mannitol/fructose-specific phosphotransferase system IIA component (Ntr-type)
MPTSAEQFLALFDENRFVPALEARSKAAALKELAGSFATDPEIHHPDVILEALAAREKLGSTGIGKEVAIPHSRTVSVPRVKVLVARAPSGIDWDAADGKPVQLLFVVVAPPVERTPVYLPFLGALVGAMQKKKNRDAVLRAGTFESARAALEEAFRG